MVLSTASGRKALKCSHARIKSYSQSLISMILLNKVIDKWKV